MANAVMGRQTLGFGHKTHDIAQSRSSSGSSRSSSGSSSSNGTCIFLYWGIVAATSIAIAIDLFLLLSVIIVFVNKGIIPMLR